MHDFLTLFYPVLNAAVVGDEAEIARLTEIKAGDPFYVVPGWNPETISNVVSSIVHVQRRNMEVALIGHLLNRMQQLKEYPYNAAKPAQEGEVITTYYEGVVDATGYAGQSSRTAIDAFSRQLWWHVVDVGNRLIEQSKIREAMYEEKELGPIKIMVITTPKLLRYIDLHQHDMVEAKKLTLSQCFDTRINNKIIIAVGRMQQDINVAEPYTYGTLKYANPTKFKGEGEMKSYQGYQMHYEFVDNIPVLGVLEVEGLTP